MKLKFYIFLGIIFFTSNLSSGQVSNVMQHGDHRGLGLNNQEIKLNTSNVNTSTFGKLYSYPVDDQLYAQPLIVSGLNINGKKHNVVFAASVNNTVYAYDADTAGNTPFWSKNFTPSGQRPPTNKDMSFLGACGGNYSDFSRPDFSPANIGIVGTPVIDTISKILYFVSRNITGGAISSSSIFQQYLHAVDITTGNERSGSPVLITASIAGTGSGSVNGLLSFDPAKQNQRTGLVLTGGIVYIPYASHCDNGPYHGWVLGYDATSLAQKIVYNSTANGYNGGIWMSGAAPSVDEFGNLYLATGNGTVGTSGDPTLRSESLLKLVPNLSKGTLDQASFFTPQNWQTLEGSDLDFGVTETMLFPNTNLAFVGVKDGSLYLTNRDNMGGYNANINNVTQTISLGSGKTLRSSFAYYIGSAKEFVYTWSENAALKAFPFNRSLGQLDVNNVITSGIQGPNSANNGVFMSVSSNGSQDGSGILWASHAATGDANGSVRPGILRAINANDVTKELWNSNQSATDNIGNFAKFVCPVIANGKVYMSTFSNQLVVYGLTGKSLGSCTGTTNLSLGKIAVSSSNESSILGPGNAIDGNLTTRWASLPTDSQWIYVDLAARFSICKVNLSWETALGKNFQIQVSDDAIKWTTIQTIVGNTAFVNSLNVSGTGRYVRMLGSARGTGYGYSLYEIQIFGIPANTCQSPVNLKALRITQNTATIKWDPIVGVISYNVFYKSVGSPNYTKALVAVDSLNLPTLACGTDYLFRVQSICSGSSTSDTSAAVAFSSSLCSASCGILPTRWSQQDIGTIGISGQACFNNSIWRIQSSGTDIWDLADQFHYAYKTFSGNGQVTARIDSLDNVNPWNKAGVMFRESPLSGARNAMMAYTSGNGMTFQYRVATGGSSLNVGTAPGTFKLPYYVKIVKRGSKFSGYISQDSLVWKQIGTPVDLGFGASSTVLAGLALTSHDNTKLSNTQFSKVPIIFSADTIVNTGTIPPVCKSCCNTLQAGWAQSDIGAVGIPGQSCYSGGVWRIKSSGADIWNNSDQFHYTYQNFSGNGQITARVDSLDLINPWNKSGVMFRENSTPGSRQAMMAYTSGNGMAFQYRNATNGTSNNVNSGTNTYSLPYYIKLVKRGSVYSGYISKDSLVWKQLGASVDLGFGLGYPILGGLALTSHDNTQLSSSQFSKVPAVFSSDTTVNTNPIVPTCPTTNIAFNRPAASSSDLSTDKSIYEFNAFDNDPTTRWASNQGIDPQWIYVDLGARYSICGVSLLWAAELASSYQIQVSDDALNWNTVQTITGNNSFSNTLNLNVNGRFIRMNGLTRGTSLGYSLYEFKVFGTLLIGQSPNLALKQPTTTSSVEIAGYEGFNAVDGIGKTRWSSSFSDPQSISVDLGNNYNLTTIVLDWEVALGRDFQIQTSPDGLNWTTIKSIAGNTAFTNVITVTGTGRYVKILGTARGTGYGYSLYEFEVYGTPALTTLAKLAISQTILFPNPASSTISLRIPGGIADQITLINEQTGKEFLRLGPINSDLIKVDISGIPAGIYLINIKQGNSLKNIRLMKTSN